MKKEPNVFKVRFYTLDGTEKRASVFLNTKNKFEYISYNKAFYENEPDFSKDYPYTIMVCSDPLVRHALEVSGFSVKDSERINKPVHLMLPDWQIKKLDELCRTRFVNYSRSDLINEILLKSLQNLPSEVPYEKGMAKTMVTLNPIVYSKLDSLSSDDRTKNHIMYDCICAFLDKYTQNA